MRRIDFSDPHAYFAARTVPDENGCWIWQLARDRFGYGNLHLGRRTTKAHRGAYELLVGPIPDGLVLDHLCKNPPCVNPAHLEAVTPAENNRRSECVSAVNARKTHCNQGHAFTEANTYLRREGGRRCRRCHRGWSQAYKDRLRAAA